MAMTFYFACMPDWQFAYAKDCLGRIKQFPETFFCQQVFHKFSTGFLSVEWGFASREG